MAHTVATMRMPSDPLGTDTLRHLEDARKVPLCPYDELQSGESECTSQLEQAWKLCQEKLTENSATSGFNPNALERFRKGTRAFFRMAGLGSESPTKTRQEAKLRQQQFSSLVEIFEALLANKWIKRASIYRRLPEAVEDSNSISLSTPRLIKAWYILKPMILFFFSFGFQSFMLHLATHFYIVYMENEKGDNERQREGGQLLDVVGNLVAKYLSGNKDTSNEGAVFEGVVNIPTKLLDASAAIPLFFCVVAYGLAMMKKTFNIGLWNKTYIVASLMAIMKGIFDVVTILPDSTGWENCTNRLTKEGLASLRNLDFFQDFWGSIFTQILREIRGGGGQNGGRVRYCADMMISGHTYFACLFSLSAYKQIAYNTELFPTRFNKFIRRAVFIICICCMIVEVVLVAAARFHYTVDMLASIVMVFLLFDSRHIEQVAADWSEGYQWQDVATFKENHPLLSRCIPQCAQRFPPHQEDHPVIPSQSTVFNHRRMMGQDITDEPYDELPTDASGYAPLPCCTEKAEV